MRPVFQFPPYVPPLGGPHYWQSESSGVLAAAIEAYLKNRTEGTALDEKKCALVIAYLQHWINAPVWEMNPHSDGDDRKRLKQLRSAAANLTDADSIARWITEALDEGIDPL